MENALLALLASALRGAGSLATSGTALAACMGAGAPSNTQTKCLTAVQIPGNPLRSFDISFVNPNRAEFYFADRSNAGVDIIDTLHNAFKRRLPGFVGVAIVPGPVTPTRPHGTLNNNLSRPDGLVTHRRRLYARDADSTLMLFDLNSPTTSALKHAAFAMS